MDRFREMSPTGLLFTSMIISPNQFDSWCPDGVSARPFGGGGTQKIAAGGPVTLKGHTELNPRNDCKGKR